MRRRGRFFVPETAHDAAQALLGHLVSDSARIAPRIERGGSISVLARCHGHRLQVDVHPRCSAGGHTPCQLEVLDSIGRALGDAGIGAFLGKSASTVKKHLAEARLYTGCTTRATCVRYLHRDVIESVSAESCDRSTQDVLTELVRSVLATGDDVRRRLRDELCILRVRAADCFATVTLHFEPSPLVLGDAEQRVVSLIGFGHGDAGIAGLLRIAIGTVKRRLHTAMRITQRPSRSAVLKRSLQLEELARSESGEGPSTDGGG